MNTGWICPRCRASLAPSVQRCFCTETPSLLPSPLHPVLPAVPTFPWPQQAPKRLDCPACEKSGICGCYRPDRDGVWMIS